ncbi:hypothetical protein LJC17_04630 [Acholeplasma sp. OttesenSCG-928-E16]|nr:hypothetical protein [Acholeplasma sp. OttesenSCG-928-E16]
MTTSPEAFKKEIENLTLEELLILRDEIFKSLKNYENKEKDQNNLFETSPSLKTIYNMQTEYLKVVIELIIKNQEKEKIRVLFKE